MLRQLVQKVQIINAELKKIDDEFYTTSSNERATELDLQRKIKTNELYDAVNDLNDYIFQETGVYASQFADLTRSRGYVMGKDIPRPRTLLD